MGLNAVGFSQHYTVNALMKSLSGLQVTSSTAHALQGFAIRVLCDIRAAVPFLSPQRAMALASMFSAPSPRCGCSSDAGLELLVPPQIIPSLAHLHNGGSKTSPLAQTWAQRPRSLGQRRSRSCVTGVPCTLARCDQHFTGACFVRDSAPRTTGDICP
jgi:hypothetical protein